jgi:hypothetical protein
VYFVFVEQKEEIPMSRDRKSARENPATNWGQTGVRKSLHAYLGM